jgi:hypothetical protein
MSAVLSSLDRILAVRGEAAILEHFSLCTEVDVRDTRPKRSFIQLS